MRVEPEARRALVYAEQGFTTNLALEDFLREENLLAWRYDGKELALEHGGPLRLVVPAPSSSWRSRRWPWPAGGHSLAASSDGTTCAWGYNGYGQLGDGTVWAWGRNNCGQLGDGTTTDRAAPVWVDSSTRYYHFGDQRVAVKKGGVVYYLAGDHLSATLWTALGTTSVVLDAQGNEKSAIIPTVRNGNVPAP
ncbi:MAG: molybdopterin-dependent oxidoreductase [Anaerolineae bacterium]|nr:molybdopterin-dependent oxidoreductase [Anaerolineae bacterium]